MSKHLSGLDGTEVPAPAVIRGRGARNWPPSQQSRDLRGTRLPRE